MSLAFNDPSLDARIVGTNVFTIPAGDTKIDYFLFLFDCNFNGIEFYSEASKLGDNVTLWTEYFAGLEDPEDPLSGQIWLRYKKFSKVWNVFPNYVSKILLFPTKPKQGIRIAIEYKNSDTENAVKYAMNLYQFADSEKVAPHLGQEGTDW